MRRALAATAAAACLALSACGLDADDEAPEPRTPAEQPAPEPTEPSQPLEPRRGLPQPTEGVVEVNGEQTGSLTSAAVDAYRAGEVQASFGGATAAVEQLCRGEIDIADSARPISFREFQLCARNGLQLRTFQVASDAVVVAIRNESDIGADCLTLTQVQRIYETGSSVENWQDVSEYFFDVDLRTAGPDERANQFDYFAQRVLDVPDDASLDDFRSEYVPNPTDEGTRQIVVGDRDTELDRFVRELDRRRRAFEARVARFYDSIIPLDRRIRRMDRRIREIDTIIGAGVDPEERDLFRQRNRLARRRAVLSRRRTALDRDRRTVDRQRRELVARMLPLVRRARLRDQRRRGAVGLFRFSFYEQYEQQLRPFEIEDNKSEGLAENPRCVFPSQATITQGVYPLARRILLFTTQRSLAREEVTEFLRFYIARSPDLAIQARLVPLPDPQVAQELEELGVAQPSTPPEGADDDGDDAPGDSTDDTPDLPGSDDGPSYRDEGSGG